MKHLHIHYLQHVPFEGPGYIVTWAADNGHTLTGTRLYADESLPDMSFDWLIIMGGPMSVYDERRHSWMIAEKDFIRKAIRADKTVIGICLGAQLIANALGGKVYPNPKKEIGWFPVYLTGNEYPVTRDLPAMFDVLHWHGDTFDLPEEAIHLMYSEACRQQAFIYKDKVLGLQFHWETTQETLKQMVDNCRHELVEDLFVQNEASVLKGAEMSGQNNSYLVRILDHLSKL